MRIVMVVTAMLVLSLSTTAQEPTQPVRASIQVPMPAHPAPIQSVYNVRIVDNEVGQTVTYHGTAFGVNMSDFGLPGTRYLLTAAHVVSHRGELSVMVESRSVNCRIVASDREFDVVLLMADEDLPFVSELAYEVGDGDDVQVIGCPRGLSPRARIGQVVRLPDEHDIHWRIATSEFDHGNSGSPVFVADRIVGMAVGGIPKDGTSDDMRPDVAKFLPSRRIRQFVRDIRLD